MGNSKTMKMEVACSCEIQGGPNKNYNQNKDGINPVFYQNVFVVLLLSGTSWVTCIGLFAVLHEFKPEDKPTHLQYCHWLQEEIASGLLDMNLFMSDEAWFHLSGYVGIIHVTWFAAPGRV
jgi:hypothetical protein